MKSEFKAVLLSAVVLGLIGTIDLGNVHPGSSFLGLAEAAQWSEGILKEVVGLTDGHARRQENHGIEILLQDGGIYPVDSEVRIKTPGGQPVPWEKVTFPSKIRYRLEKGLVVEIVLIEALPR